MAVSIDELQVQTEPAAPPSEPAGKSAAQSPQLDFKAEIEKHRERELRLQAD
jgi:hypothetical protein